MHTVSGDNSTTAVLTKSIWEKYRLKTYLYFFKRSHLKKVEIRFDDSFPRYFTASALKIVVTTAVYI